MTFRCLIRRFISRSHRLFPRRLNGVHAVPIRALPSNHFHSSQNAATEATRTSTCQKPSGHIVALCIIKERTPTTKAKEGHHTCHVAFFEQFFLCAFLESQRQQQGNFIQAFQAETNTEQRRWSFSQYVVLTRSSGGATRWWTIRSTYRLETPTSLISIIYSRFEPSSIHLARSKPPPVISSSSSSLIAVLSPLTPILTIWLAGVCPGGNVWVDTGVARGA